MELRKKYIKNIDQKARKSGLLGIIDKAKSINLMINNIRNLPDNENLKTRREIQSALLEAECLKAQANELTRRMKYM